MRSSGFRRGHHSWRGKAQPTQGPIRTPPPPPLGSLLETVTPEDLSQSDQEAQKQAMITQCNFLASYNWIEAPNPELFTPGMPAVWDPPAGETKLEQDSGEYLRDQNAGRYPKHPMEPAARAVLAQDPDFSTGDVDIFGCTSTLGNLIRFLKGHDKGFRFTVEAVGRTVFFVRRENAPDEKMAGPRGFGPTGHGHTFPEHYTKWQDDVAGSASHQRVLSYNFAGLRCLVRSEADGYLEHEVDEEVEEGAGDGRSKTSSDEDVANKSETLAIDGIKVRRGGRAIPQHAIFELKTRGIHKKDEDHLAENLPRCWLAQIPFFILALHEWGLFKPENITVEDVRPHVAQWQENNQVLLSQLANLLEKLVALARDPDFGKYEVCLRQPGKLEIRQQGGTVSSPLSDPLIWTADNTSSGPGANGSSEGSESDTAAYSDEEDGDERLDYTACTDSCGYCGRCFYK